VIGELLLLSTGTPAAVAPPGVTGVDAGVADGAFAQLVADAVDPATAGQPAGVAGPGGAAPEGARLVWPPPAVAGLPPEPGGSASPEGHGAGQLGRWRVHPRQASADDEGVRAGVPDVVPDGVDDADAAAALLANAGLTGVVRPHEGAARNMAGDFDGGPDPAGDRATRAGLEVQASPVGTRGRVERLLARAPAGHVEISAGPTAMPESSDAGPAANTHEALTTPRSTVDTGDSAVASRRQAWLAAGASASDDFVTQGAAVGGDAVDPPGARPSAAAFGPVAPDTGGRPVSAAMDGRPAIGPGVAAAARKAWQIDHRAGEAVRQVRTVPADVSEAPLSRSGLSMAPALPGRSGPPAADPWSGDPQAMQHTMVGFDPEGSAADPGHHSGHSGNREGHATHEPEAGTVPIGVPDRSGAAAAALAHVASALAGAAPVALMTGEVPVMSTAPPAAGMDGAPGGTLAPGLGRQVSDQLIQSLRMQFRNGIGEAVLHLRPEHLGPVTVSLRVEAGQVSATVQAELPAVRQWLESQEAALREGLAQQGLDLGRLVVTPDGRQAGKGTPEDGRPPRPRHPRRDREAAARFDALM